MVAGLTVWGLRIYFFVSSFHSYLTLPRMVDLKEQQPHCVRLKAPKGFSVLLLPSRQSSRFCTPVCEHLCFTKTNVSFKIIDEFVEVQREWFHGVDEVAAPLISAFYTISLNFSMSDVFWLNSSLLSEFSGVKLCIRMESFSFLWCFICSEFGCDTNYPQSAQIWEIKWNDEIQWSHLLS